MPEKSDPAVAQSRVIADDDAGFVARCRRGEAEAFAPLIRKHQKRMLNVAYRMIGDYDEACDVTQEAFLAAWRAIGQFRGESRFSTWLCGIVMNHARNHLTLRAARTRNEGVSLDDPAISSGGHPSGGAFCTEPSVIERMERRERDAKVQECISALESGQREVLVLRDIQGFSYEEIGTMLQLHEGTVRSRLFRARTALKNGLRKVFGDLT